MYRDHRYRKSKTGRTWEPEYLRFPGSRDRVIIHRLPLKGLAFSPDPQKFSVGVQILSQTQLGLPINLTIIVELSNRMFIIS